MLGYKCCLVSASYLESAWKICHNEYTRSYIRSSVSWDMAWDHPLFYDDGIELLKCEGCLFFHPSRYFSFHFHSTVLTASWTFFLQVTRSLAFLSQESVSMSASFKWRFKTSLYLSFWPPRFLCPSVNSAYITAFGSLSSGILAIWPEIIDL